LGAIIGAGLFLIGCGGGSATPSQPAIAVAVTPSGAQTIDQGQTQNFTAMVSNDSANKGVTWSLSGGCSGAACGTLANIAATSVTYNAPASLSSNLTVTITATSASDSTKSASVTLTVTALTVSVSPTSANVSVNITQQFTATVNNDASNKGVSWTLTQGGAACSPACGTISPSSTASGSPTSYAAPGSAPSPATVTLTATSVADLTKSVSASITITASNPANNAALNGQYAFLLNGFDADGAVAIAGSFTADGNGNILSGGVEDINRATGVNTSVAITGGSYSVFADNRGTLTLTTSLGTFAFRFALGSFNAAGVATKLRIIEFDASGTRVTGIGELQDPTAFSVAQVSGDFAFGGSGADFTGSRFGIAGRFSAAGGSITNGEFEANGRIGGNLGGATTSLGITGSYTVAAANGRGTLQLIVPIPFVGASFTLNFSFYVVSANELLFISTDPRSTTSEPLSSGQVLRQSPSPAAFSQASLNGISVLNDTGVGGAGGSDVEVGLLTTNGAGSFTFATDENNSGVIFSPSNCTGSYKVTPGGLGQVFLTVGTGGCIVPVLYLVSQNKGFVLFRDSRVETGSFEPQAPAPPGGFTNASISGNFLFGVTMPAINAVSMNSGVLSSDGTGAFKGTVDSNTAMGLVPNQPIADTYSVSANGRTTTGSGSVVIYIVSDSKALFLDVAVGKANAAVSAAEK